MAYICNSQSPELDSWPGAQTGHPHKDGYCRTNSEISYHLKHEENRSISQTAKHPIDWNIKKSGLYLRQRNILPPWNMRKTGFHLRQGNILPPKTWRKHIFHLRIFHIHLQLWNAQVQKILLDFCKHRELQLIQICLIFCSWELHAKCQGIYYCEQVSTWLENHGLSTPWDETYIYIYIYIYTGLDANFKWYWPCRTSNT